MQVNPNPPLTCDMIKTFSPKFDFPKRLPKSLGQHSPSLLKLKPRADPLQRTNPPQRALATSEGGREEGGQTFCSNNRLTAFMLHSVNLLTIPKGSKVKKGGKRPTKPGEIKLQPQGKGEQTGPIPGGGLLILKVTGRHFDCESFLQHKLVWVSLSGFNQGSRCFSKPTFGETGK